MSTITENSVVDKVQIPIEISKRGNDFYVVQLITFRTYFRDPFFIDSLAKILPEVKGQIKLPEEDELLARPVHFDENDQRLVFRSLEEFIRQNTKASLDRKLGFIFHMSRCGSTLVSQMLAANSRFFVLSEPTIINAILDPALDVSDNLRKSLLVAAMKSLVMCMPTQSELMFVKFRSWNTLFLETILTSFPSVPWMFVHRQGTEVFQSVLQKPPGWLRSKRRYSSHFSKILAIPQSRIEQMDQQEYVARLLASFCDIAYKHQSSHSVFLEYPDIKNNFIALLEKLWHIKLNKDEIDNIHRTTKIYSKDTSKSIEFKSDTETKKSMATDKQVKLVEEFIEPIRVKLKS